MISISRMIAVPVVAALWGGLAVVGVKTAAARGRHRRQLNPLAKRAAGRAAVLDFSDSHARGWRNRPRRVIGRFTKA